MLSVASTVSEALDSVSTTDSVTEATSESLLQTAVDHRAAEAGVEDIANTQVSPIQL